MKKEKFIVFGMLVIVLCLTSVSCNNGTVDETIPKSIKITEIPGNNENCEAGLHIFTEPQWGPVRVAREIYHSVRVKNGEVLFELKVGDGYDWIDKNWTGSGEYYINFIIAGTDGWPDEGGSSKRYWWAREGTVAKYNIQDALTTLEFTQFMPE